MAIYTITVPDEREPCIDAARQAFNAAIPPTIQNPADPDDPTDQIPNPDLKPDNAAYMDWVMNHACESYCVQYFGEATPTAKNSDATKALSELFTENSIADTTRNEQLRATVQAGING